MAGREFRQKCKFLFVIMTFIRKENDKGHFTIQEVGQKPFSKIQPLYIIDMHKYSQTCKCWAFWIWFCIWSYVYNLLPVRPNRARYFVFNGHICTYFWTRANVNNLMNQTLSLNLRDEFDAFFPSQLFLRAIFRLFKEEERGKWQFNLPSSK